MCPTYLEQGKPLKHSHDEAEADPIKQQYPSMRLDVRLIFLLQSKPTRPHAQGTPRRSRMIPGFQLAVSGMRNARAMRTRYSGAQRII